MREHRGRAEDRGERRGPNDGAQRRQEANDKAYQEMRARYDVVIEPPAAEPAP